jgi:GT2 family glycosyltransferase
VEAPTLAVVIVAYDSADHPPTTLQKVAAQLEPDELVVVDNASDDAGAATARRAVPSARVIELADNRGCHAGAAASSAPLLLFLNPDTQLGRGCLAALRETAARRPEWQPLVVLPGGAEVNTSGGVSLWTGVGWAGDFGVPTAAVDPRPRQVGFASCAPMTVRRAAWDAAGGFDPAYFMYGEDLDVSLRLRLAGWESGIVPGARVEHCEFAKGDYKWFLLERHRWWTVLGAYPAPLLAAVLRCLLAAELALLVVAARSGWLRAQAVIGSLPWALACRRRSQATRRASLRAFAGGLTVALDSPFLGVGEDSSASGARARYLAPVGRTLGIARG